MYLEQQQRRLRRSDGGYAMAALLVSLFVMSVLMAMAMPVWHHAARREKEAELIFRGEQYARAIALWQRQRPGSAPPDIDTLVEQRFLRKKYTDPMTEDGEFQVILQSQMAATPGAGAATAAAPGQMTRSPAPGGLGSPGGQGLGGGLGQQSGFGATGGDQQPGGVAGGIVGVVSKSEETSIALYNGRNKYSEWAFVYTPDVQAGAGPGQPGGQPGGLDDDTGFGGGQPGSGFGGGFDPAPGRSPGSSAVR